MTRILLFSMVLVLLSGCSTVGFYTQSVMGHMRLMMKREDVQDLIADQTTPDQLRRQLELVVRARRFAADTLALPDNDSYDTYVDTGQRFVVWNVVAAEEFSIKAKEWCFLFTGCIQYRGYYAKEDAEAYAAELKAQGLEVYVSGAIAYSTLGWFDDPVLNTFVNYPEPHLVGLIFHELAHQQLYVKNDSAFNESFATLVEMEGVKRWISSQPETGGLEQYEKRKQFRRQFVGLVANTTKQLKAVYASNESIEVKRQRKAQIIEKLKADYAKTKQAWGGYKGYDNWFSKEINNAQLAAVSTYEDLVPAFRQLLKQNNHDLPSFYLQAKALGEMDQATRQKALNDLRQQGLVGKAYAASEE